MIGVLIVAYLLLRGLLLVRIIFPPLVLAVLIIYVLNPVVNWLEGRRVRRTIGVLLAYVVVLGSITIVVMVTIPLVSNQVEEISDDWPEYRSKILDFVDNSAKRIEDGFGTEINTAQVSCLLGADPTLGEDEISEEQCDRVTRDFREAVLAQAGRVTQIGSTLLEALLIFIIGPLIALYLLIDLPHLRRDLINLVPEGHRDEFTDLMGKVGATVGGFFRGQLVVAILVGILSALGFYLIGLPFWLVIGAIAGFFNLVPLIGPYIGGAIGFFVGTISEDVSLGIKAAVVELIVQQIDNHVISPNVMKRTVNLHPVTVMLSILAGGTLAGFWGVLLGVPAVAVGKLLLGHVWATRVLGAPVSPHIQGRTEPLPPPEDTPDTGADEKATPPAKS